MLPGNSIRGLLETVSEPSPSARIFQESFFIFFDLCRMAYGILVPQSGMEPIPPTVEAQSPNYWTARELP